MATNNGSRLKRCAELPDESRGIQEVVSKSDLMEAAWDLASLVNETGSADDHGSTREKLIEFINARRESRGQKPLRFTRAAR